YAPSPAARSLPARRSCGLATPAPAPPDAAALPDAAGPAPTTVAGASASAYPETDGRAAPAAADAVAVDVIDYDDKGEVVFSGRGPEEHTSDIQPRGKAVGR